MLICPVALLSCRIVDAPFGELLPVAMLTSTVVASLSGAKQLAHDTAQCARAQFEICVGIRGGL